MQHRIKKSLPKFKLSACNASSKLKPLDSYQFRFRIPLITVTSPAFNIKSTPDSLVELCTKIINSNYLHKPSKWQISEVVEWINDLGFSQYQDTLRKNFINGSYLMQMDANSLVKINIKTFDHIQIITDSITSLNGHHKSFLNNRFPHLDNAFCQFYRIHLEPKCREMLQLMEIRKSKQNHWQALETWLQHEAPINNILIGKPRQINEDCKFVKLHY